MCSNRFGASLPHLFEVLPRGTTQKWYLLEAGRGRNPPKALLTTPGGGRIIRVAVRLGIVWKEKGRAKAD